MEIEPTGTVTTTQTSYVWEIEDLDKHSRCKPGEAIKSPIFTTLTPISREKMWNIFVYFSGDCEKNKSYVSMYVQPKCNTREEQQFRLSILNKHKKKVYGIIFYDTLSSSKDRIRWGSSRFIHKHILCNMADQLTPNHLTILCEMVVSYTGTQNVMHYQEKKMHTDVGALLENGLFSDLTLIVEGKNFSTHKNILAARSTAFEKWFKDGTIKPNQESFEIDDVSCKIFTKILHFIYAEKTDFHEKEALDLLKAATKYELNELKILCEEVLGENLNIGIALPIHVIAHLNDAMNLKERTMNFIISNAREMLDTPEYKTMVNIYPHLLQEIYEQTILRN